MAKETFSVQLVRHYAHESHSHAQRFAYVTKHALSVSLSKLCCRAIWMQCKVTIPPQVFALDVTIPQVVALDIVTHYSIYRMGPRGLFIMKHSGLCFICISIRYIGIADSIGLLLQFPHVTSIVSN